MDDFLDYNYSRDDIKQDIIRSGAGLGIPRGWLEQIAEITTKAVDEWIADKSTVTEDDIRSKVVLELEPLNADMAYAFDNYDKII